MATCTATVTTSIPSVLRRAIGCLSGTPGGGSLSMTRREYVPGGSTAASLRPMVLERLPPPGVQPLCSVCVAQYAGAIF